MPFVIRPNSTAYELIGACYIWDLMDGDFVRKIVDSRTKVHESWIKLMSEIVASF